MRDLRIEIDKAKRQKQVKEIVETDLFYLLLVAKALVLSDRNSNKTAIAESKGT